MLLLYYGVLVRFFFTKYPAGVAEQTRLMIAASEGVHLAGASAVAADAWGPLVDLVRTFLAPAWPTAITVRWLDHAALADALAGYRLVRDGNPEARADAVDAVPISEARFAAEGWADRFTVRVRESGVVLAHRRQTDHSP